MKTKEIEVYVNPEILIQDTTRYPGVGNLIYGSRTITSSIKAKLIIEIPEKKIEITESRIEEVLEYIRRHENRDISEDFGSLINSVLFGSDK